MTIKILTAPPASGKTIYCVDRVLETSKAHPHANIWVLVPNGYS